MSFFIVTKTFNVKEVVKYIILYPKMEYYVVIKNYFQRCFYVFFKTFQRFLTAKISKNNKQNSRKHNSI